MRREIFRSRSVNVYLGKETFVCFVKEEIDDVDFFLKEKYCEENNFAS